MGIGHRDLLAYGYQIRLMAVLIKRDILPTLNVRDVLAWRHQYLATVTILLVLPLQRIKTQRPWKDLCKLRKAFQSEDCDSFPDVQYPSPITSR